MAQRASLGEAFMRDPVQGKAALSDVSPDRDRARLMSRLKEAHEAQSGGVVVYLVRPAEPGRVRWPAGSGINPAQLRNCGLE